MIDLIPVSDNYLSVAVGDASGHGFDSSLLMALTRAYVCSYCAQELGLVDIMTGANRMLVADLEESRYVTLLLVHADGLRGTLCYASAGHVPGFMLNRSGEIEALMGSTGLPLGMFEGCRIETKSIRLTAGSIVVLLTDGVSEASDPAGEQLGLQSITEYVRAHRTEPAQDLAQGLCQHGRAFSGPQAQQDDIAAVVLKAVLNTIGKDS